MAAAPNYSASILAAAARALRLKASTPSQPALAAAADPASPVAQLPDSLPVYDPGNYGDMTIIPIVFAGLGDVLALPRPKNTRILLVIQNTLAANPINFAFDRAADNVTGLGIIPGGNAFFDARVPQNDLHIFSPAPGTVLVGYINVDITANPAAS